MILHCCYVNHKGSSGSMESSLALKLIENLYANTGKTAFVHELVTDDATTTRTILTHTHTQNIDCHSTILNLYSLQIRAIELMRWLNQFSSG